MNRGKPTAAVVIVAGACGFIGRHTAKRFSADGARVVGLGHGSWPAEEWGKWGLARWEAADVSRESLSALGEKPSVIVNCAGGASVAVSIDRTKEDAERTVGSAEAILEFVRLDAPGAKVVMLSSAAVYGEASQLPIAEDAPLAPISPYGRHKLAMEDLCRRYCAQYGLSVAILRLFSVYGPGLRKQLFWDACRKLEAQSFVFQGTGEERRDWLHISDATELIRLAAQRASNECPTINGGCGRSVTVRAAVELIANAFKSTPPNFCGERRPGDPPGYEANIRQALALGWTPKRELAQGIAEYVAWYRSATT